MCQASLLNRYGVAAYVRASKSRRTGRSPGEKGDMWSVSVTLSPGSEICIGGHWGGKLAYVIALAIINIFFPNT